MSVFLLVFFFSFRFTTLFFKQFAHFILFFFRLITVSQLLFEFATLACVHSDKSRRPNVCVVVSVRSPVWINQAAGMLIMNGCDCYDSQTHV